MKENGSQIFNFDFIVDGIVIDKLIGSSGAKQYSITDYPPEFQEKMLDSARQLVALIRRSWYKPTKEADAVNECLLQLLHWGSIPFMAGLQLGIFAQISEPERFAIKPKEDVV